MNTKSPQQPDTESLRNTLLFGLALLVAMAVFTIATAMWLDSRSTPRITFMGTPEMSIAIDVRGAVATPGVMYLDPGDRMIDVVEAAGGLTSDADRALINLSSRVNDGQVITIPTIASEDLTTGSNQSGLININTASADELKQLPGIGDVLANRIIAYREFNGPYQTVDDLTNVEGVSSTLVDSIRDLITVSGDD